MQQFNLMELRKIKKIYIMIRIRKVCESGKFGHTRLYRLTVHFYLNAQKVYEIILNEYDLSRILFEKVEV